MKLKQENLTVFAIAGTYVGTVVGAGFATGQEVMQFFTLFGLRGTYGVIVSTLLFAVLGAATLRIAHRVGATSHREVLDAVTGPVLGRILDGVLATFLFAGAGIMMAGSGAVFAEHWQLSRTLGTVMMAALSAGTVLFGLRGVVASISAVAPILIGMVLLVSGWSIMQQGFSAADLNWSAPQAAAAPAWPMAALLYVSYNLFFSLAVLAPLGGKGADAAKLGLGGLIGGAALGLGAVSIHLALLAGLPESTRFEVPMLHLAGRLPFGIGSLYSLVLWAEIYTTAVSLLYGLAVRYVPEERPRQFRRFVVGAALGGLMVGQFGFAKMVAVVFPAIGWLALIFIAALGIRILQREVDHV